MFALAPQSTAPPTKVRYFRIVDIDRAGGYLTRYEITGKDTARAKCYRCTYDKQGRLIRWEYISARRPEVDTRFLLSRVEISYGPNERRHVFFDDRGNPSRAEGTGSYGTSQFSEIIRFIPGADSAVRVLLNRKGEPMKADHDGCSYYTWKLDARGLRIRQSCFNQYDYQVAADYGAYETHYQNDQQGDLVGLQVLGEKGELLSFTKIGMDEKRNRRFEMVYAGDSSYSGDRGIRYYEYDKDGNPIEEAIYSNDSEAYSRETRLFDAYGNVVLVRQFDPQNQLVMESRNEYDALNQLVKMDVFEKGITHAARVMPIWDESGKEIERNYYIVAGGEFLPIMRHSMKYDSLGFMVRYETRDADKNYLNDDDGIALYVWERDKLGDVQEIRYYDQEGKLVSLGEEGYSIVKYFYHPGGEVDRVEYLDADRKWIYSE